MADVVSVADIMNAIPRQPDDFTEKYNTPLPANKQKAYEAWAKANGQDPIAGRFDYDLQGAFLANSGSGERGHFTDQFKKPNHPTFSDESQYHGIDGYVGGTWTPKGYQPSQTNLSFRPQSQLAKYFQRVEPQTPLMPATPIPQPSSAAGLFTIADLMKYGLAAGQQ